MKQAVFNIIKNLRGLRTQRKIVVFSVDDYGNIRLDSQKAREKMDAAGLKVRTRFDAYDTLETKQDIEQLVDVLTSVKDKNGRSAVFTPFAMSCNIDFESMANNGFSEFVNESVDVSFKKLSQLQPSAYEGAWELMKKAIEERVILPQYHGREHLNLKVFKEKIDNKDFEVITALKNRSYTSISNSGYSSIKVSAAFQFWDPQENQMLQEIVIDGARIFADVYGYAPVHFNAPGGSESESLHETLVGLDVKYIDVGWQKKEHLGFGKYQNKLYHLGKKNNFGQQFMVRNCVFEPTMETGFDSNFALKQVESAFVMKKPAIISSHRINFCGHIDPRNRDKGLGELKKLLNMIVKKWPDVEFFSAPEAMDILTKR